MAHRYCNRRRPIRRAGFQHLAQVEPVDQRTKPRRHLTRPRPRQRPQRMGKVRPEPPLIHRQQPLRLGHRLRQHPEVHPRPHRLAPKVARTERGAQNRPDPPLRPLSRRQRAAHLGTIQRQHMPHRRQEHLFLRTEIMVRQRRRHPRPLGDLADRHVQRPDPADFHNRGFHQRILANRLHSKLRHRRGLIKHLPNRISTKFIDSSINKKRGASCPSAPPS